MRKESVQVVDVATQNTITSVVQKDLDLTHESVILMIKIHLLDHIHRGERSMHTIPYLLKGQEEISESFFKQSILENKPQ